MDPRPSSYVFARRVALGGSVRAAFFFALVSAVAACSSGRLVVTAPPNASGVTASPASPGEHGLGETVTAAGPGGAGATVVIAKYEKLNSCKDAGLTAGDVFIGVSVSLVGTSGAFGFAPGDWSAGTSVSSGPLAQGCYRDLLKAGNLAVGGKASGWLLFEIPSDSPHLSLTYRDPAGTVLNWQLY